MTAQISDSLIFHEQGFKLAAVHGEGLFNPAQQGLSPQMLSTACYRGYWCTYAVVDASLSLQELHIGFSPEVTIAARHGKGPLLFEQQPLCLNGEGRGFTYSNLSAPISFTGGLLIAADFIQELYFHGGFHPAWKFRNVHELVFEGGRLVQARDCSSAMAELREKLEDPRLGPLSFGAKRELRRWVAECFTRLYKL